VLQNVYVVIYYVPLYYLIHTII